MLNQAALSRIYGGKISSSTVICMDNLKIVFEGEKFIFWFLDFLSLLFVKNDSLSDTAM